MLLQVSHREGFVVLMGLWVINLQNMETHSCPTVTSYSLHALSILQS